MLAGVGAAVRRRGRSRTIRPFFHRPRLARSHETPPMTDDASLATQTNRKQLQQIITGLI